MSHPLLTPTRFEGETADLTVEDLWQAYRLTGGREDRDRLVLHYLGLVTYVASRTRIPATGSMDHADLIQSGVIGLMDAVDRFDPERGLKFETYAVTRIRGAILDAVRAQDWVPRSVRRQARELDAAAESCRSRLGRTPSDAELADELGASLEQLDIARASTRHARVGELDAMTWTEMGGEGQPLAETLADPFAEIPGAALEEQADRDALQEALRGLSERSRAVLTHSFVDGLTLAQIGRILGVTESRVCQLRTKALRELADVLKPQLAV